MIQSYDSPGTGLFKKLLIHKIIVCIPCEISTFEVHMKKKSFRVTTRDIFFFLFHLYPYLSFGTKEVVLLFFSLTSPLSITAFALTGC